MNWKAVGLVFLIAGIAAAGGGWAWADSVHEQRHSCRLGNVFSGSADACPSKTPAIILAAIGGVLALIGIALTVGASSRPRQ